MSGGPPSWAISSLKNKAKKTIKKGGFYEKVEQIYRKSNSQDVR
jgi:hypothetical protein